MLRPTITITTALAAAALAAAAVPANARMHSTKVEPGVCLTKGGGRFVNIPGFPGEMIDRRLLRDVKLLERRYRIFVTDGYSTSDVHAANGEHPVGLALDIVPDKAAGGSWAEIDALAAWAEPKPGQPIAPFRWVGYDGDANHGRGHHLHLSWAHSPTKFGEPAKSVYTVRCPKRGSKPEQEPEESPESPPPPSGGTESGKPQPSAPSGGVEPKLARPVAETGGVDGSAPRGGDR
jgi:hypothetical protein